MIDSWDVRPSCWLVYFKGESNKIYQGYITAKTEVSATKKLRIDIESPNICRRGFNLAKCYFDILSLNLHPYQKPPRLKAQLRRKTEVGFESPNLCRRCFNLAKHYFNILFKKFNSESKPTFVGKVSILQSLILM